MSTPSSVEEFLDANLFISILSAELLKQAMWKNKFATVPQIGMIGVPQVRVGIVGCAKQLVGNHTHFRAIIVHVTGTIILELHSNVCD